MPGIYYLDLVTLQTEYPEISSKKALKKFLETTAFLELHLVCKHIPPWLENSSYNITQSKNKNGNISAILTRNYC